MNTIKGQLSQRVHAMLTTTFRWSFASLQIMPFLCVALLLQGCLSESSDSGGSAPESDFITWIDNSNGEVILDYNNEHFAVLRSHSVVYLDSSDVHVEIHNARVADGGGLYIDNAPIGQVSLVPGSSNGSVAAFVWVDTDSRAYFIDVQRTGARTFIFQQTNAPVPSQPNSGGGAGNSPGAGASLFASATQINAPGLVSGTVRQADNQAFSFVPGQSGSYTIALYFSEYSDLDLTVYNSQYAQIASSQASSGGAESVTVGLSAGSRYYAVVSAYNVTTQSGQQSFDLQVSSVTSGFSQPMSSQFHSFVPEQKADTPVSEVSVRINCDRQDVEMQFSNTEQTVFWPGKGDSYVLSGQASFPLTCAAGEFVCYSAKTRDGKHTWGLKELGGDGCTDCCFACDTPADIALTCDE